MANKIKCTCGHSWNKSDSSKKDVTVCHICGKNNMKDGGWLDKFDVPEAQNGIEGTMGGLTDIGFNYNGAWGGPSMAMGGSMPGAVGFTYARTGGIPSNGPYAKKTKASAQNGKEMKFYQEGLDWKPRNISRDGSEIPQAQLGLHMLTPDYSQVGENIMEMLSVPQKALTKLFSGKYQTPSEAMGIKNKAGAIATDILLDPANLVGGTAATKIAKGVKAAKVAKAVNKVDNKELVNTINKNLAKGMGVKKQDIPLSVGLMKDEEGFLQLNTYLGDELAGNINLRQNQVRPKTILENIIGRKTKTPIDKFDNTVGYSKYRDYPFGNMKYSDDDIVGEFNERIPKQFYNSGISGEFNKAINETLKSKGLGNLLSDRSGLQSSLGKKRWEKLVEKGLAENIGNNLYKMKKQGGNIKKDDNGYWNPENWGEPVEIGSNEITMQGVYEPLLGVSDTGDVQYMEPGQDYKFKGNKVTEYPIAQEGIKTSANPYFKSAKERDAYRQRLKEVSEQALSVGSDEDLLIGTSYHNIDEGNNCINGICGLNRRAGITYNKPTDVDRFLSGEKFAQAVAKGDEDYYQVDGNFQIGDHMMYRKKKGTASHNKIIYDSFVNNQGEKVYKVIDNAGGKQMKTDNYTESELKKMQLEGGGGYDKVNIYRPGYSIDKTLIEKERLERTSPEARKALADRAERIAWETSNNPGYKYSIRKDSEYYNDQPEGMQKFIEFANDDKKINKLVEKLGVDKGVIHDELLNTFGELGQENKWEDRTFGGTGGIENTIEKIFKPKSWSIGPGQIKFNTIDPELKQKFNIKKPKDLYDFDKIIPLMTAMNIKNRKYMENQGKDLSTKLIGKPGVGADELEGGVGRWTPYMYRGKLSNPVSIANEEIAGSDLYGQELTDKRNSIIRDKASLFDKGSYASNVFENIDKNLERTLPGEYFYLPQEMQPIKITAKKKKKNGGWLEKYK